MIFFFFRVATLPGKPVKVRKFENWPEKSLNLKIDQKIGEKSGDLAIDNRANFTVKSRMCVIRASNHIYVIFPRNRGNAQITYSPIRGNPRIVHLIIVRFAIIKISYCEIPQNFGLPIPNFWIFWFNCYFK